MRIPNVKKRQDSFNKLFISTIKLPQSLILLNQEPGKLLIMGPFIRPDFPDLFNLLHNISSSSCLREIQHIKHPVIDWFLKACVQG